jgi:hypothetical protein
MATKREKIDKALSAVPPAVRESLPQGYKVKAVIHDGEVAFLLYEYGGFVCSSWDFDELVSVALAS